MKMRNAVGPCLVLVVLVFALPARAQRTVTMGSGNDVGFIGMAHWGACTGGAGVATICAAGTLINLRDDGACGGLNNNVIINAGDGNDSVSQAPNNSYDPGSAGCGIHSWDTLTYNSHWLDIYGQGGADILQGAHGSDDTQVHGGDGNDYCYNYSSIGWVLGENNNDQLISSTTGGSDGLLGASGDDCLTDSSNSVASGGFDCGTTGESTGDYYTTNNASIEVHCEHTTSCCGIC